MTVKARRFRDSIRFKLLLASLSLLAIPVAGYLFLHETERFLRTAQEQNVLATARALASVIPTGGAALDRVVRGGSLPWRALPVHRIALPPDVDGYRDEWNTLKGDFTTYSQPDGGFSARVFVGRSGPRHYFLFDVLTRHARYGAGGDRIDLSFTRPDGTLLRTRFAPEAPGSVLAREILGRGRERGTRLLPRIRGAWQEHADGYAVELVVPSEMIGDGFSFRVTESGSGLQLGNAQLHPRQRLGRLVDPAPGLEERLRNLLPPGMRGRITDSEGIVVATAGSIDAQAPIDADQGALPWFVRRLLLKLLPGQEGIRTGLTTSGSRLAFDPVLQALAGRDGSVRHVGDEDDYALLGIATPIRGTGGVVGALLLEQTTGAILSIQNLALQRLLLITLALFGFTSLVLLIFASLLSGRIRSLRDRLERAVSHDGRITGQLDTPRSRDEIGDLQRSFGRVLERLKAYNQYLEDMASRLAHELRTPLSIVRTSLDNADQSPGQETGVYLDRAREGARRLELILQRLREATRLEQSLTQAEFAEPDLGRLLVQQVEALRGVYADVRFDCRVPAQPVILRVAPDLVCQAVEKLAANAVDFHTPGSEIMLELAPSRGQVRLSVTNRGPHLPENIDPFQSMTSVRERGDGQPHLGLGLYLARLIAEFHGGSVAASNLPGGGGVVVCLVLPRGDGERT